MLLKVQNKHLMLLKVQRSPALMVYKFFNKKTSGSRIKNKYMPVRQLADELHKPIT